MTAPSTITIDTPAGSFAACLARPAPATTTHAVLLLPEIYNLNDWIREVADRYAALGYTALVPDLFWRQAAGVDLPYTPEGQQQGRAFGAALQRPDAVTDLLAAATWLRTHGATEVTAIGFCLGGELALLAAAESPMSAAGHIDAAVAYYPTRMEHHLEAVARLSAPSLVHIGERDWRTPPDMVTSLRDAMPAGHELHVYAEADHGFARFGHPPFHAPSNALALQRTLDWMARVGPR